MIDISCWYFDTAHLRVQTGSSGTSVARDANDDNITSCRDRISFYVPFFPSPFSSSSPQRKFTSRLLVYFFARRNTRRTSLREQREREKENRVVINYIFPPTYFERYSVNLERDGDPWNWIRTTPNTRYESTNARKLRNSFFLSFLFFISMHGFFAFRLVSPQWPFIRNTRVYSSVVRTFYRFYPPNVRLRWKTIFRAENHPAT